jgi:galactokinase
MKDVSNQFGKEKLSEISKEEFFEKLPDIKGKVSDRALSRALHYFCEVDRVRAQVSALEEKNISKYLELMQKSGDSSLLNLQNIYPVSVENERSLSLALGYSLNLGVVSRVHGGGFAGTIQALVKNEDANTYKTEMERLFGKDSCHSVAIRPVGTYLFEVK